MRRIFVPARHVGGAKAIAPVIKRMQAEGRYDILAFGYHSAADIFASEGLAYRRPEHYKCEAIWTPDEKTYQPAVSAVRSILETERPDLILTGTSAVPSLEKDVLLAAKELDMPTIAVLDFWGNYWQRFSGDNFVLDRKDARKEDYLDRLPTEVAIMDRIALADMLSEGFPEERLAITGNPAFDGLRAIAERFSPEERSRVRAELGGDPDKKLVLFGTTEVKKYYGKDESHPNWLGYTDETALEAVAQAVAGLGNVSLAVKMHPNETDADAQGYQQILRDAGLEPRVIRKYDVKKAMLAADLVASTFSTVLIEAALMERPAMSVQPGLCKEDFLSITNKRGITQGIYTKEGVRPALEAALFDSDAIGRMAEARKAFRVDGKAAERVHQLVAECLA